MYLTQAGVQWWALVNSATQMWVPRLTECVPTSPWSYSDDVWHMGLTEASRSPQNACPARYQGITVRLSWLAMSRKSSGDKLRLNSSLKTSSKETVSQLSNYSDVLRFRSFSFSEISARLSSWFVCLSPHGGIITSDMCHLSRRGNWTRREVNAKQWLQMYGQYKMALGKNSF
jgi:hypothetical protein